MKKIDVNFRNRKISLACDNEERLRFLAAKVNSRIQELESKLQNAPEVNVAFITALTIQDELDDIEAALDNLRENSRNEIQYKLDSAKESLAKTLDNISSYIEDLALRLDQS
jgi:cell division protein ZapA (FtsZ GTPase activity inhibitor)